MKKFCVLTTGRAGSTALMNALDAFDDILMPGQDGDGGGAELAHPREAPHYARVLSERLGRPIRTIPELVDAFFESSSDAGFAGFKTMPNRHPDSRTFFRRPDIQFITLTREDLAANVASFMAAGQHDAWLRKGGAPDFRWAFDSVQVPQVIANIRYLRAGRKILDQVPGAIALTYEQLCTPAFENRALDDFFGRHIAIGNPMPPTDASRYVDNYSALVDLIRAECAEPS